MFIVTWLFDKIGFMPKPTVKITFPVTEEQKAAVKKVAKKAVKIPKATTRKPKTK